jgi:cytochrome b
MLLGFVAGWFLAVRIVLGFCGSRPVRWQVFFHSPKRTLSYLADVVRWRSTEHGGLNPGTSLFAMGVYLGLVALIVTGFDADWAETWHGRLGYGVIGLITCHLVGLTLHALRGRELSPLAMIHGHRNGPTDRGLARENWVGGLALLVLSVLVCWMVFSRFDPVTAELRLPWVPGIQFPVIQKG